MLMVVSEESAESVDLLVLDFDFDLVEDGELAAALRRGLDLLVLVALSVEESVSVGEEEFDSVSSPSLGASSFDSRCGVQLP